jgi:acetyl-CoA carboxylase biotin carboxyl carrier protein
MSETTQRRRSSPDKGLIESVWQEARDLIQRLEGSTVQRLAVEAGEYKIEIERGAPSPQMPVLPEATPLPPTPGAVSPGPGPGVAPEARAPSGVLKAVGAVEEDNRIPILAPLVGTFYRASQPGAKPFVEEGDVVEAGQTVCIVEAMKLMNEVPATDKGKVLEISVENGQWVEFEQVLIYLEPVGE